MQITLSFIADYLNEYADTIEYYQKSPRNLHGVRMLLPGQPASSEDLCYICRPGKLSDSNSIDSTKTYILVGSDDSRFQSADRIIIYGEISSAFLYQFLLDMFELFERWQTKLYEAVIDGTSIQSLLEMSSPIFGNNPISVVNGSLLILGYVQNQGPGSSLRNQKTVLNHHYLEPVNMEQKKIDDFLTSLETKKFDPPSFQSEWHYDEKYRMLHARITSSEGNCFGQLSITEYTTPLKHYHLEAAKHLVRCLCKVLEEDAKLLQQRGILGPDFLVQMLLEGTYNTAKIKAQIQSLGWHETDYHQLFVLDFPELTPWTQDLYHFLNSAILQFIPNAKVVYCHGHLVIICNSRTSPVLTDTQKSALQTFISARNAKCGCSTEYTDFTQTQAHYKHACYAASKGMAKVIHSYTDDLSVEMLEDFAKKYPLESCLHPDIITLAKYDHAHHSNLVLTLYTYLSCDRSYQTSAQQLNVHRSTFRYRLDTIKRLIDLDIQNPDQRLNLLLSAKLWLCSLK